MPKKGQYKASATADSKKQRKYNSQTEQKRNRVARNTARRRMERDGKVRKGDGKDVDHKRGLMSGGSNARSNLRVRSRHSNRTSGGRLGGKR